MRKAFRIISNKYLIAFSAFVMLMLFFDHNDIFTQMERRKNLHQLEAKRKFFETEISKTNKELNDLQHDPAALEKYAREKYILKKDNEDVFLVDEDSLQSPKAQ
jgi:cell division protein DivIC